MRHYLDLMNPKDKSDGVEQLRLFTDSGHHRMAFTLALIDKIPIGRIVAVIGAVAIVWIQYA